MAYLVLIRHGESQWNKIGLWQGWKDIDLTNLGREQAKKAGECIKNIKFDSSYSATLKRAKHTLDEILPLINQQDLQITENAALNERDYGDYTGKNKWQVKAELGEEEFQKLRRNWDYPIPNGESLKQVNERIWPYFQSEILPKLKQGKNVIISSSGNAFRALLKSLENLSEDQIASLEFGIGEVYVYQIDSEGKIISKEIRNKNPLAGKQ